MKKESRYSSKKARLAIDRVLKEEAERKERVKAAAKLIADQKPKRTKIDLYAQKPGKTPFVGVSSARGVDELRNLRAASRDETSPSANDGLSAEAQWFRDTLGE